MRERRRMSMGSDEEGRSDARPRDAATVLVLRQASRPNDRRQTSECELEVFCVERHKGATFLGGAVVFPGGQIDPGDRDPGWQLATTSPPARAEELTSDGGDPSLSLALLIAACRELLEEGQLAPIEGDPLDDAGMARLRQLLRGGRTTLLRELSRAGLRLDVGRLVPWGRWITPEGEPKRFDTRFYLLALPRGQVGLHDAEETTRSFWATPVQVLERWMRGEIQLVPPTARALELLSGTGTLAEASLRASRQSLRAVCPVWVPGPDRSYLALPGDPSHPVKEVLVDGPTRFVLQDGRFVSERFLAKST